MWEGLCLPAVVLRAAFADPAARRAYLRTTGIQLLVILAGAACMVPSSLRLISAAEAHGGAHVRISGSRSLAWLSLLYGSIVMVEWIVAALWRDHNDALAHVVCVAAGAPPEELPVNPRVRVDFGWLWRRVGRRVGGVLLFGSALPFLLLLRAVPVVGPSLQAIAGTAWGVYWLAVLTAGRTALAWAPASRDPWFLRGYGHLTDEVFGFRWWLPRGYGRLWRRLTRKLHAPAAALERAPLAFAGLLVGRALAGLPLLSLILRPAIVAAAALLLSRSTSSPASR